MNMGTENEERGKRTFVTGLNDLRGRAEGGVSIVDIQTPHAPIKRQFGLTTESVQLEALCTQSGNQARLDLKLCQLSSPPVGE